eukprot:746648-Hanusia_phi.AAC.1
MTRRVVSAFGRDYFVDQVVRPGKRVRESWRRGVGEWSWHQHTSELSSDDEADGPHMQHRRMSFGMKFEDKSAACPPGDCLPPPSRKVHVGRRQRGGIENLRWDHDAGSVLEGLVPRCRDRGMG